MPASPTTPIEVFYSYAREDEPFRQQLEKHLSTLRRQGLITQWHDRHILAGTDWSEAIDTHLENASVILLLISADFLASDYCYGIEMKRALARAQNKEAYVVPIILRPVDWTGAPFAHLQVLPTNAKPITTWSNQDEAFADVAAGIRRVIEDLPLLAASASRVALSDVWNIPYPRNSFFIGRENTLSLLHTYLQASKTTAISQPALALSGLGGIGKTQIAVEYAYRYHQNYQFVLWARAESREALTSSYITIADLLKLPEKGERDQTITVQAVKRWLQTKNGWLLILDNADELALLPEFLPPSLGGHLLLTTRASALGHLAQRVEVQTLPPEQGALLLLRRATLLPPDASLEQISTSDQELAVQISQELGELSLALDQAGAYIEETQCSLSQYLQHYRTHQAVLLRRRGGVVLDHPEPVATTWSLSFEKIEQANPVAADLLRLCAFLHPDSIPEELLIKGTAHLGPHLLLIHKEPFLLDEAVAVLRTYSLLRRNARDKTLSIHRLVQVVVKDALTERMQKEWALRAVRSVNAAFPLVDFTTWQECERYLPHAQVCMALIQQEHIRISEAAMLLTSLGWYLAERGQHAEAEPPLTHAMTIHKLKRNAKDLHMAFTANTLGHLYGEQEKYKQAEPLLLGALEIRTYLLGLEHPATIQSLHNLACLYQEQGNYREAESLLLLVLTLSEQQSEPDPAVTAIFLNSLGGLYIAQKKYKQAERLFLQALAIQEQQLGTEHPDTATNLTNLAGVYRELGQNGRAEPLLVRALAINERQLGSEHLYTAECLHNLAGLYKNQGKYEQAESLYMRALAINERLFGPEHSKLANSLNKLADVYWEQEKYEQMEPLLVRALTIQEQQLGSEHLDTATSINNLATIYEKQGKYDLAEPLLARALAIWEHQLGSEHPDTALGLNNLGALYHKQGKSKEAAPLCQRALTIHENCFGSEHFRTAESYYWLASIYQQQQKYKEAEPLYQRAFTIMEHLLGPQHPNTKIAQEEHMRLLHLMNQRLP